MGRRSLLPRDLPLFNGWVSAVRRAWGRGRALVVATILLTACGAVTTQRPRLSPPPTLPSASPSAAAPSAPSTAPTPAAVESLSPEPVPTPTPAPTPRPGTFLGTVVAAAGADIHAGPGSDTAVTGHEPAAAAETFDGWCPLGDDPPVADATTGALENWSQDWFRLADGRGWIHSALVKGTQPAGMPPVAWAAPPVRDVPIPAAGQRRIVISLRRQHLWAFDGSRLVVESQIATGRPALPTPPGTYHVFAKRSPYKFVSPWPPGSPFWYASAWSTYAMEFIGGGYFIHDAPWRWRWGPGANLADGSHGCVNVQIGPMTTLWGWTRVGEEVVVQYS